MSSFSNKEKRDFLLKKYLKEHIGEEIVGVIIAVVMVLLLSNYFNNKTYCDGMITGVVIALVSSLVKFTYNIYKYDKSLKNDYPNEDSIAKWAIS